MDFIITFIKDYDVYIIIGLLLLIIIMLIISVTNSIRISNLTRKYKKFMRGSKDKNLEGLLMEYIKKVDGALEKSDKIKALYDEVDGRLNNCIQKVSLTRYKAFDDMGGSLSFSLALLDGRDDGVIITGIYGRDEWAAFAKPIDKGIPKYDLSEEEEYVLKDAMSKKTE